VAVDTPEHVRLDYALADLGSRAAALALDLAIILASLLLLGIGLFYAGRLGDVLASASVSILLFAVFFAQWGYFRYAGVYRTGAVEASRALAGALGLPQVLLGQPEDSSTALEAARDEKVVVSAWIGGGPGLRDYREEDMRRVRNAVLNALRHLGMLAGELEFEGGSTEVIDGHTFLTPSGERGFTFIDKGKRGCSVAAGEQLGYVMHPYTGEILEEIRAPRAGVMLHAGASWPLPPEGAILAILGDPVA